MWALNIKERKAARYFRFKNQSYSHNTARSIFVSKEMTDENMKAFNYDTSIIQTLGFKKFLSFLLYVILTLSLKIFGAAMYFYFAQVRNKP